MGVLKRALQSFPRNRKCVENGGRRHFTESGQVKVETKRRWKPLLKGWNFYIRSWILSAMFNFFLILIP